MIETLHVYDIQPTEPPWFSEGRLIYVLSLLLHNREEELMPISCRSEGGVLYKLDGRHRLIAQHILDIEEIPGFLPEHEDDRHDKGRHLIVDPRGIQDSNNAIKHRWDDAVSQVRGWQEEGIYTIEDYCNRIDEINPITFAQLIAQAQQLTDPTHPHGAIDVLKGYHGMKGALPAPIDALLGAERRAPRLHQRLRNTFVFGSNANEFAVLYDINFGHSDPLITIPIGVQTRLDATNHTITYLEPSVSD